jgi:hypothetical protein
MRFLKCLLKLYFSWTKKGADHSVLGLVVRAGILIFFCLIAFLSPIHAGEYAVYKTILFIIGSISLTLTPYLQGTDHYPSTGFYGADEDSIGPFINAETPGCIWIFFGLLLWMIVGILCSSFLVETLLALVE